MKRTTLMLCGATALLVAHCSGNGVSTDSQRTFMTLSSSPSAPHVGDTVTITVTVRSDLEIVTVGVDFTNDGTMDATQSFHTRNFTTTFTYAYPAAGTYEVDAAVTDASGMVTTKSLDVTVAGPPQTVPVYVQMNGVSPQDGRCFALGPPATCPNCDLLVGTSTPNVVTVSLGERPHGAYVSVNQGFNQAPVVFGDQTYRCDFALQLYTGVPGHERGMGNGTCSTSSLTQPAVLNCQIAIAGAVP